MLARHDEGSFHPQTGRESEEERPRRSGEGVQSLYEHLERRHIEDSANRLPSIDEHASDEHASDEQAPRQAPEAR